MNGSGDRVEISRMTRAVGPHGSVQPRLSVRRTSDDEVVEIDQEPVFDVRGVSVSYGAFRAIRDITMPIGRNEITALIGPSGCGKTTFLRCLNRMNDLIAGARVDGTILYHGVDLYDRAGRRGRGPPADRDGVPEAQPVPQVDLRQRRLRARGSHGFTRRHWTSWSSSRLRQCRALGRGERTS